jgi:hypothetical protein
MRQENTKDVIDGHHYRLTVSEAGRLGGLSTLSRYGLDHYRKAGRKGQSALNARFGKTQRVLWGSKGGRPKKLKSIDIGENR